MSKSILGDYKIVSGTTALALEARDHLIKVAEAYWNEQDLRWAFPYVYALVTNEIITKVRAEAFEAPDALLHWVVNFYELYVLNLNSYVQTGKCESPWYDAFTKPKELRGDLPWGARSSAAFIVGMYAHIKSDLPRALAYVHLKFWPDKDYDSLKPDFDSLNQIVFPAVMEQMAAGKTQIIPSVVLAVPDLIRRAMMDKYAEDAGLNYEREVAWKLGWTYASHRLLKKQVPQMPKGEAVTAPRLEKKTDEKGKK